MLSIPLGILPEVGLAVVFVLWLVGTRRSRQRALRHVRRWALEPSVRR